jgi:oxygen-independent coproporphyrinogen-3 oxidase
LETRFEVYGAYISFPFCRQKCTYCNFASGVFTAELQSAYLQALREEILASGIPPFDTLYLGGGTPSLLSESELTLLLADLDLQSVREFTMEAAPGDLTPQKAEAWSKAGVNRVSFGVQSFDQKVARGSGRKHTAATVAEEVALLRSAGIQRVNVDLIAGLAWQTAETWAAEFEWIERLAIRHVSVYMLESDDDSRLGAELRKGGTRYGASAVPEEEEIADSYLYAVERLRGLGIQRYEISNFAAPGHESIHNRKYWTLRPYLGFGADAHSFDGARRWANVAEPAEYVGRTKAGQAIRVTDEVIDDGRRAEDLLMTGLRTREGVTLSAGAISRLESPIVKLVDLGWLEQPAPGCLRLTDTGILFSNEALEQLLF